MTSAQAGDGNMFMPRKKQRISKNNNSVAINGGKQRVVMVNNDEDIDRERRKKVLLQRKQRINTHFDFMDESVSLMNIMVVCQLASTLYLEPQTVLHYCKYWMGEFANRTLNPDQWFGSMVKELLTSLPMLEISGQVGLRYTLDRSAYYPLLLRFAGSELHRIPHVHFNAREQGMNAVPRDHTSNALLLRLLAHVLHPTNQCFLSCNTVGGMSEFFAESFVYNTLLEEFYEPSFLVLTCFMLYIQYLNGSLLYNVVNQRKVNRSILKMISDDMTHLKIELVTTALEPIKLFVQASVEEASVEKDVRELDKARLLNECGFIDRHDEEREQKSMRMLMDLVQLILCIEENILDIHKLQSEMNLLWYEKMRYCCKEMSLRTEKILSRL